MVLWNERDGRHGQPCQASRRKGHKRLSEQFNIYIYIDGLQGPVRRILVL